MKKEYDNLKLVFLGLLSLLAICTSVWLSTLNIDSHMGMQGAPRSSQWPKIRREHLAQHPECAVCGNIHSDIQVHHILNFSDHPEFELDPENLLTLCGPEGCNAHFWLAHCRDYRLPANPHVKEDAKLINKRYREARQPILLKKAG